MGYPLGVDSDCFSCKEHIRAMRGRAVLAAGLWGAVAVGCGAGGHGGDATGGTDTAPGSTSATTTTAGTDGTATTADTSGGIEPDPLEPPLVDNTGEKKVAVLLVDLNDATNEETPEAARQAVFASPESTRAYYETFSYGKMTLVGHLDPQGGDVFGPVVVDMPSWPCEWDTWAPIARSEAAALGFDPSNYDYTIYVFAGACTGFGKPHWTPPSYVDGGLTLGGRLHEGGHMFGWLHANKFVCTVNGQRVTLAGGDACRVVEYGDLFSLMGSTEQGMASLEPPNNFLRGQFGWFDPDQVRTVRQAETVALAPIDVATGEVQVVRVPRVLAGGTPEQFVYVEARTSLPGAVLLRLATRFDMKTRPLLLDAHPETETFTDAELRIGERFEDPRTGIVVEPVEADPDGRVTVAVEPGTPLSCSHRDPSGAFLDDPTGGPAGQTTTMQVRLRNEDVDCGYTLFVGTMELPPGWPQPPKPPDRPEPIDGQVLEATLVPGQETTIPFPVTPPAGTAPGTYPVAAVLTGDFGQEIRIEGTFTVTP